MCCPTFGSSSGLRATEKSNNQTVKAGLLRGQRGDYRLPAPPRCAPADCPGFSNFLLTSLLTAKPADQQRKATGGGGGGGGGRRRQLQQQRLGSALLREEEPEAPRSSTTPACLMLELGSRYPCTLTCWGTGCSRWRAAWSWGWRTEGSGRRGESSPGRTEACNLLDCDLWEETEREAKPAEKSSGFLVLTQKL